MVEGFVPAVYWGGADFRRLLMDIEGRYSGAFDELGPGALQDFKHMIDCVDAFLDLLADPRTDFRVTITHQLSLGWISSSSADTMRAGWAIH